MVCNINLAPTILGAAGLKFEQNIDGENILSLFQTPPKKWRSSVFCETHGHLQPHVGRMVVKGKFKYIYNKKQKEELYDLYNDPYELMNLVDDINYTTTLKAMRNELREWQKKTNDPEKDKESIDS
ncbi:sulfatase/phosphatase domain-containing protein [Bacillus sp. SD088]|uniref:sulfatase/phosphatase domain-containing protein n=1 Tax=Bacillus sp. SD088 TaxID=2782012 RepID=UPI001A96D520|nr:sulfatase/phosphatase domain-containing protein [Bacillus sp. SD088]MBO0995657.1 DUF4976 domain-containing protein [Bacillus sp. SD088]